MNQDWDAVLRGNVNEQWNKFRSLLERREQQYIPSKCIDDSKHKNAVWLSYKAVKSVRRKHKVYTKYKNENNPAYFAAAKQADKDVRNS